MTRTRTDYLRRYGALKTERSSWESDLKSLSDLVAIGAARWTLTDTNRGNLGGEEVLNNVATLALRTLSAGFMNWVTNPSRPWVRLTTPNPDVAQIEPVREALYVWQQRIMWALARSNFYMAAVQGYRDLGGFGFHCALMEEDERDVVRFYPLPMGEYCLAASGRGVVDTVYREVPFTIAQAVELFGRTKVSAKVRDAYDRGEYDTRIAVVHAVEPNYDHDPDRWDSAGMAWRSVWFEMDGPSESNEFLRVGGFREFPALCPRWSLQTATDIYGRGPGHEALRDVRALQQLERRKLQLIDKTAIPPMRGPEGLRRVDLRPGEFTASQNADRIAPAMEVPPAAITETRAAIAEHSERIRRTLYEDVILMLAQDDRAQRATAREIDERHEEKLVVLSAVVERITDEYLRPMVARLFNVMMRRGMLPPAPRELVENGNEIKIEFISTLHLAQKIYGLAGIERTVGFVGNLAAVDPSIIDKIDRDAAVDAVADLSGIDPSIVRSAEEVQGVRQARQQAAQAEQMAKEVQTLGAGADAAKVLSETDVRGDSALNRLLSAVGPQAVGGGFPGVGGGP